MSNAMRRVANYLGLVDDPEIQSSVETPASRVPDVRIRTREPRHVASVVSQESTPQLELPSLDRIITLHPRFYNEARTIGEHYRQGNPVIINLTDMDESERKRLVDFASGLVFGHHGTIERVTSKVFLLSPANVKVSSEDKAAAAEASFLIRADS
jgi:cell division inhibitor SepF